jgi:hypothetical protein
MTTESPYDPLTNGGVSGRRPAVRNQSWRAHQRTSFLHGIGHADNNYYSWEIANPLACKRDIKDRTLGHSPLSSLILILGGRCAYQTCILHLSRV